MALEWPAMGAILIIEDEALLGRRVAQALRNDGHDVRLAETGERGLQEFREGSLDLVLVDLRLPDISGLDILREIREDDVVLPVVLMTAFGTIEDAVSAMQIGASDYVQKPLDLAELRLLVDRLLDRQRLDRELAYHRQREQTPISGIVGSDPRLVAAFSQIENLRGAGLEPGRRPAILLTGETGTGKGVVARRFHEILGGDPFIEINCTAMPGELVEGELFGHERGSFTDAKSAKPGLFEAASGGSLFLDEIGHATPALQAKLLKVIEDKRVRRIGSSHDREVNVHVIAATNRELSAAVEAGEFRADLLHRLSVLTFELPPLRGRGDDLRRLAEHFCETIGKTYGRDVSLSENAHAELARYSWPGNVRELRNVIERALLVHTDAEVGAGVFASLLSDSDMASVLDFTLPEAGLDLAELERELIRQALERTHGNRSQAASLLGLTRDTLRYRLEKHGLDSQ